jgi:hypothetical protein
VKENKLTPGSNLRWESSRMMIPQHKEALNERQDPKPQIKTAQIPSREELELIRDHVMLPYMLTIVERNGKELQLSTNSLQKLYLSVTDILMNRIHSDLAKVNRELRERKIKVFQDEREDMDLHYRYICRGYENKFAIMRDVARSSIVIKIGEHIQRIVSDLNVKRDS